MVRAISPRRISCKKCGWSRDIPETSDCLIEGFSAFEACPECGNKALNERFLSGPEVRLRFFEDMFRSFLNRK